MNQGEQRHFAGKYFIEELLRLVSTRKSFEAKPTGAMTRRPTIAARTSRMRHNGQTRQLGRGRVYDRVERRARVAQEITG